MTKTLTPDQAYARIVDDLIATAGADLDYYSERRMNEIRKLNTRLAAELKKAESAEMVATLLTALREKAKLSARGLVAQVKVARRFVEITRSDATIRKALLNEMTSEMAWLVQSVEADREAMRTAKDLMDQADAWLAASSRDADAAAEEWAQTLLAFESLADSAIAEAAAYPAWEQQCRGAAQARDVAALAKARKAMPPRKSLDLVSRLNRDTPFADYFKRFDLSAMPESLRQEIERDANKALAPFSQSRALAVQTAMVAQQMQAMVIEPLDARKALAALGLPTSALARLQAAVNVPVAERTKSLTAFAKAMKLALTPPQMTAKLKAAGVW